MFKTISKFTFAAALAVPLVSGAAAQAQLERPEFEVHDLGSGVYAIYGRGGNIGVSVGDDGVFVIDDQFAPLTDFILEEIAALSDQPVRFVLNTHWHGDHTGGNEPMAQAGATIVAHENVRTRMEEGLEADLRGNPIAPAAPGALPVVTHADGMTFHMNGLTAHALHVPNAHTDGDTVIYFEEANVIHMGDIFFSGFYPFVDVASGGSVAGTIEGLALGLSLANDETRVIPGHGPMSTKADLQAAYDVMVDVQSSVAPLVEQGLSEEEAVAADPLAHLNDEWGQWFIDGETMTRLAYRSIAE